MSMLCGWLDPNGKLYKCEYWGHSDLAYQLVEDYKYKYDYSTPIEEVLIENGWIKLYYSMFDRNHIQFYGPPFISEAQKNILRNDYFEHPDYWGKDGKFYLEEYDVIEPTYDERGIRI